MTNLSASEAGDERRTEVVPATALDPHEVVDDRVASDDLATGSDPQPDARVETRSGASEPPTQPKPSVNVGTITTPTLILGATVSPKPEILAPEPLVTIKKDTVVTFRVSSTVPFPRPQLFAGQATELEMAFTARDGAELSKEWTGPYKFVAQPPSDVYAQSKLDGTPVHSKPIRITVEGDGNGTNPDKPAELEVGEYDQEFAGKTGAAFRTLAFVLAAYVGWIILWTMPVGGAGTQGGGTWNERVVAAGSALVLGVGLLAVLTGVWMAALEVRGRQRSRVVGSSGGSRGLGGIDVADIERLTKALGKARGTVAAFVVGIILILIAMATPTVASTVGTGGTDVTTGDSSVTDADE